ncbi:aminopeptidase [Kiloniella litopenaei]|uniref:aminopeptidase n=1 Tax=Kiloniella litopenaei TaxID=1549748 RepID=UPI003BAB9E50
MLEAVAYLIDICGSLKTTERCLLIFDTSTKKLVPFFEKHAENRGHTIDFVEIPVMTAHGQEPPSNVSEMMLNYELVAGLTLMSLAHTRARLAASKGGCRYLSLPEYTEKLLTSGVLFGVQKNAWPRMQRFADAFENGTVAKITTPLGTNLTLNIAGRSANFCPGIVSAPGELGSPPDMEVNISPLEFESQGTLVIDGSITHPSLGLLKTPVILTIKNGIITEIFSSDPNTMIKTEQIFLEVGDDKSRVLAELGIGFNEEACLNGSMLIDEGTSGYLHFGFGANHTVGGNNEVAFHIDFVMGNGCLEIDNVLMIKNGEFLI